jgi:hypothetical protein
MSVNCFTITDKHITETLLLQQVLKLVCLEDIPPFFATAD